MMALLDIKDLVTGYDGVPVVRGLSMHVDEGAVVALLGANGAGKTTVLQTVAGFLRPQSGSVEVLGASVASRRPHIAARQGLVYVPDDRCLFRNLSARENLDLVRRRSKAKLETAFEYFPALENLMSRPAGVLSGGEQQMLVMARALLARPRLLMVDEPSLGLAPKIVDQVYEILLTARQAEGLTLLINEQSSHRILKHADRIYVIRNGHIQLHDTAINLQDGEAIKRAYFGFGA